MNPSVLDSFNGRKRTGDGRPNHERMPASVQRELQGQYLAKRAATMTQPTLDDLVWIKRIERKTREGYPAWVLAGDKNIFNVTHWDSDLLDKFAVAGFDLRQMLMYEVVAVKILIERKYVNARRGGLDAQRPVIASVQKFVHGDQTMYSQVAELITEYGYVTNSDMTSGPGYVVDCALGDCSGILPYLKTPWIALDKIRDWLTRWQVKQQMMGAAVGADLCVRPSEVVPPADPILAALADAGATLDAMEIQAPLSAIYPQHPERPYFTQLLTERAIPDRELKSRSTNVLLLPATVPDRPAPIGWTVFTGVVRTMQSGPTIYLAAEKDITTTHTPAPLLLPAFTPSTMAIMKQYDEAVRALAEIAHLLPTMPLPVAPFTPGRVGPIPARRSVHVNSPRRELPLVASARPTDWPGMYEVLVDGKPLEGVNLLDDPNVRRRPNKSQPRPSNPARVRKPSPWAIDTDDETDRLNAELRAAFMKGAATNVRPQ